MGKQVKDSLGNRIKSNYENRCKTFLIHRMPVIIRLDGKAFHTFTRGCTKPFDENLSLCMTTTALKLCNEIQGCKCAYVQSDEISLLLTDFDKLTTDAWFDYNVQKMVSVSAAIASVGFSNTYSKVQELNDVVYYQGSYSHHTYAYFDSRAFNIPREEVCNYFVWRQKDWLRNSIQMLAQAHFSHKELQNCNTSQLNEMFHM
jgi:tRNA(His) 5'-end guanylyltransferase